ncbi:MAG: hypothetical protein PSV16_12710 [Flavobacterium sp.]|nr:hypothetical protein [Flavobacterium sp.]
MDEIANAIYINIKSNKKEKYYFDLIETEWISNQELLFLTGLLKYFIGSNIQFEINFYKKGTPIYELSERKAIQIIQVWENWQIAQIIPNYEYKEYLGFDPVFITNLKKEKKINLTRAAVYKNNESITPFLILEYIKNYDELEVEKMISKFLHLNSATQEIIKNHNLDHPFINNSMASIIVKELYENFLDHFETGMFSKSNTENAFMSLSLHGKIDENKNDKKVIQHILFQNFREECLPESKSFFYDQSKGIFKNQSYIEFSFLDFGVGIPTTLREEFEKTNYEKLSDSEILNFAFKHNSSRHPIQDKLKDKEIFIPRGLFDLLSLVKRYSGLIIVRSNYGKMLYDFSDDLNIGNSGLNFGKENEFFPGTLISIYIPTIPSSKQFDKSTIKPQILDNNYRASNIKYLNLFKIIKKLDRHKANIYDLLICEIRKEFSTISVPTVTYLSFLGCDLNNRVLKKTIYFLLTDYDINVNNNVIILFPPGEEFLLNINYEIMQLNQVVRDFKLHPLPFIHKNEIANDIRITWLGVYNDDDRIKLNNLLYEEFSLSRSDFQDPDNVVGNLNTFDNHGNLKSNLPDRASLNEFYFNRYNDVGDVILDLNTDGHKFLKKDGVFLCSGNYYQKEYFQLINLLNDKDECNFLSKALFDQLESKYPSIRDCGFIAITSSSHKILNSFIHQNLLNENTSNCLFFDSYVSFENDEKILQILSGKKYILICDVLSTGRLTKRIDEILKNQEAELLFIGVIADTIDKDFEYSRDFINIYGKQIVSLKKYPIKKYPKSSIDKTELQNVIRINPFTNIPITLSKFNTYYDQSVLIKNEEFIDFIDEEDIEIAFQEFNNLIHPYFFNLKQILIKSNKKIELKVNSIFKILFDKLRQLHEINDLKIVFPKNSDIRYLSFDNLKNYVIKDHSITEYQLERYNTSAGWKFPHTTDYYDEIIKNNAVLILDDGSCTGDSLLQMINEIAYFNPKNIILLSLVGRVDDHKREFFSRLTKIKSSKSDIDLHIYFGTHWHVPTYYANNNPNSEEYHWLKELIKLQNTPENIKIIARNVLREISPKNKKIKDYKYLPTIRNSTLLPKKEILLVRNEIGKVTGYRFYIESFIWFNAFITKYSDSANIENRYKEIELLCFCFMYEPYLYNQVRQILPDIAEKVEEFVEALIFGNSKRENKKINLERHLTYDWTRSKKDIIHLFFVVFQGEKLEKYLTTERLIKLFEFTEPEDSTLTYILYKFLIYSSVNPLFPNHSKTFGHLLHTIDVCLQNEMIKDNFKSEIKVFKTFVSTLTKISGSDFNVDLSKIKDNYRKLNDAKMHNEAVNVHLETVLVELQIMGISYNERKVKQLKDSWEYVSSFIEDILSFTIEYGSYLSIYLSKFEGQGINSLRTIHGQLSQMFSYFNATSNFDQISELLLNFREGFINSESVPYKIFNNISSSDVIGLFFRALDKIKAEGKAKIVNIEKGALTVVNVDFPQYIFNHIILNELVSNISSHADENELLAISFVVDNNRLMIEIANQISKDSKKGGGNGLYRINQLKKFPNDLFQYENVKYPETFIQKLSFKII